MIKINEKAARKPADGKDYGEDPNARRFEEKAEIRHRNALLFHKALPIVVAAIVIFLIFLLFIVLPVAHMEENANIGYFGALIATGRGIFMALLTIVLSDFLGRLYKYIKKQSDID